MYPRRLSQSIVSVQHNLNIRTQLLGNAHNDCFLKYALIIRQKISDFKSIKEVNKRFREFIKSGKLYKFIIQLPHSKSNSNVLKIWVHHCECVFAHRIRRCQQMVCLYSKWWEEQALKDFFQKMRQTLTRKSKFALGGIGISIYNWEENRISIDYIKQHANELDYVYILKENTICLACDTTNKDKESTKHSVCKCGVSKNKRTYDEWATFIEQDDLIVWRRLHPSGQYEYKVYGSYNDVSAEDFLNVQIDTDYRRKWDVTAVALEVAESDPEPESNSDIIYWEMLWPRLFVNRDYVFNRRYFVDEENSTMYIVSKSTEHPNFPKYAEKYRIEDYWSCMVIKPYTETNKPGIEFSLTYFDNPGVNVPSSVTTWVSMRAMPDFLQRLREATKKYRDYCKTEGVSRACKIIKEEERLKEEQLMRDKLDYCSLKSRDKTKLKEHNPKGGIEPTEQYDLHSDE
ncbi:stAR-related lipid transfer protein 7, mitochondrial-like isoform X2 [Anoplophora glabripennis]|uniref:stAR-related lipid transfer protein 7, mitochondrial-like isoform X2 n=1 Tax=Anoplophora glabripennis TaxID=217634 RepID=UPI000873663E|nr:stAR-related lipid transfer protein 7, mitochondrial-like isoform X2 [Anoplophora glabripennis]